MKISNKNKNILFVYSFTYFDSIFYSFPMSVFLVFQDLFMSHGEAGLKLARVVGEEVVGHTSEELELEKEIKLENLMFTEKCFFLTGTLILLCFI